MAQTAARFLADNKASVSASVTPLHTKLNAGPSLARRAVSRSCRRQHMLRAALQEAPTATEPPSEPEAAEVDRSTLAFPYEIPMDPNQKTLTSIPLALFYPVALAAVAASGFVGLQLGKGLPVSRKSKEVVSYATAAVATGAAIYGGVQAKKKRDSASIVDLYNTLVEYDDPATLTADDVQAVGNRYGINMRKDQVEGLKKIYGQFLENIIPTGENQLRGDEATRLAQFKDALGLTDEEAAPVHLEVGQRLSRAGIEYKSRNAQFEQRKAFSRLIYVSQVLFGDQRAAHLLPWRRMFNMTDAQMFVARRDNAKSILVQHMEAQGGKLMPDRDFLRELRKFQTTARVMDESAEEVIQEYARRHVEELVQAAITASKLPIAKRDGRVVVDSLNAVLTYNRQLTSLAGEEELPPGLTQVTLAGGVLDKESAVRDVREVFRAYVDERVGRDGGFTDELEADMQELQTILLLSTKQAQSIREEIAAKVYRKLLRMEVTSRRIDQAASPAQVLQDLCMRARFSSESAAELHKQLYQQKLQSLVGGNKKLSDADLEDLKRIRRILCIPNATAAKVQKESSGRILDEVISDIYLMGAKPVGEQEAERVATTINDLKLDADVAVQILAEATRARFKTYVQQAQKSGDRKEAAATMKKMVQFNSLVVTPILEKMRGFDAAKKELAEMLAKAVSEASKEEALEEAAKRAAGSEKGPADPVKEVQKMIAANRGEFGEDERRGQKEITLRDDVDAPTRAELYKTYLMYAMSGDVVELPVGGFIRKKTNNQTRQAEMSRLSQLADILGMSPMEVSGVQQGMAEEAFKAQAQEVLRGTGELTAEKRAMLEEARQQLGLPQEAADRVIKSVRTEVVGVQAMQEDGQKWTVERVMELHNSGVDVVKALEEPQRRNLFRREVEKRVSNGSAEFDADFMLKQLPTALGLDDRRVRMTIKELVASRKRMCLVQAVSQFRQKRVGDAARSLANLVACYQAAPEDKPIEWTEREELKDLLAVFCAKYDASSKQDQLAKVLGVPAEEAAKIKDSAEGQLSKSKKGDYEDVESFF